MRIAPHVLLLTFLLTSWSASGQRKKLENLADFDNRKIHFGFSLGMNNSGFIMETDLTKTDSLAAIEAQPQAGFNLGILSDLHMGPYLNLRFTPDLSFGQRNLEYYFVEPDNSLVLITKKVESTWINFPLSLKYRSFRLNNFATYFIVGGRYTMDLASQAKVNNEFNDPNEVVIKLARNSFSGEVGIGWDFFMPYFKFSPEIKFVRGFNNLIINDDTDFSNPISSLQTRIWTISLHFEG